MNNGLAKVYRFFVHVLPNIEKTVIFQGSDVTISAVLQFAARTKEELNICGDSLAPTVAEVPQFKDAILDLLARGAKCRFVAEITKANIGYCKQLQQWGIELRHMDGCYLNVAVSETGCIANAIINEEAKITPQLVYSSVKSLIEQQQYLFEILWGKAIPAEQRTREIEEGIGRPKIEVTSKPESIKRLYLNLTNSAKEEVLLILPTANAFLREQSIGVIDALKDAVRKRGVKVRLLSPVDKKPNQAMVRLKGKGKLSCSQIMLKTAPSLPC